jgi:hypothetical protein
VVCVLSTRVVQQSGARDHQACRCHMVGGTEAASSVYHHVCFTLPCKLEGYKATMWLTSRLSCHHLRCCVVQLLASLSINTSAVIECDVPRVIALLTSFGSVQYGAVIVGGVRAALLGVATNRLLLLARCAVQSYRPHTMYGQGWKCCVQARLSVLECGQCLAKRTVLHSRNAVKLWLLTLLLVCNLTGG